MSRQDQISSFLLALFGLMTAYGSYRLELGSLTNPGPGFLPFWAGISLLCLSSAVFAHAILKKPENEEQFKRLWAGVQWKKILLAVVVMTLYANIFDRFGFVLSTFFLMLVLFKSDASQRWSISLLGSLLVVAGTYLIFEVWFQSNFPQGFLGF